MTIYEYRTVRLERASWPRLTDAVFGPVDRATSAAGGCVFALCAGLIGFASDEGTIVRAWPDGDTLAREADRTLAGADMIVASTVERLVPTARPLDATPPRAAGVYAHRWFWLQAQDWDEFQRLSVEGVWPFFESDGCQIIGLWRSAEPGPLCKSLLVTRYPSVAHWERTRLLSPDAPAGANEDLYRRAQQAGRRRAELTERSIVRLTRLLLPRA
ncbi:MAG: hypothetical protein EPO22_13300 [Dehalococcoidia bacterium]|nr:MAG: hypothetical protein EPO22_13300 [Dehalococcoidia bacterium]